MLCPPKKRRKLRWRRARQACDEPLNKRSSSGAGSSVDFALIVSSLLLKFGSLVKSKVDLKVDLGWNWSAASHRGPEPIALHRLDCPFIETMPRGGTGACSLLLPGKLLDRSPRIDSLAENVERKGAGVQHLVMEGAEVELVAQSCFARSRSSRIFSWPIL